MVTSIITEIPISKKGELKFFEVNIPKDVTLCFDPQAVIKGNVIRDIRTIRGRNVAGTIKLQSENIADLYYNGIVTFGSSPVETLLPGYTDVIPDLLNLFFTPYYENDYKPIPQIEAMDSYILYGCYEDLLGAMLNQDVAYAISLTLWTKLKDNDKKASHDTGTGK